MLKLSTSTYYQLLFYGVLPLDSHACPDCNYVPIKKSANVMTGLSGRSLKICAIFLNFNVTFDFLCCRVGFTFQKTVEFLSSNFIFLQKVSLLYLSVHSCITLLIIKKFSY